NPLVNESFDAFGKRRGSDWAGSPSGADWTAIASTTRRGYTDHSMLDNLELIHMNGRVQDPYLGRFVSGDPYITEPGTTQNYNRYGYVHNRPLTYTDPSGFDVVCGAPQAIYTSTPSPSYQETLDGKTYRNGAITSLSYYTSCEYVPNVPAGADRNGERHDDSVLEKIERKLRRAVEWVCENPAITWGGQLQLNAGFFNLFGFEGQVSFSATSHGQLVWAQSAGAVVGFNQGVVGSLSWQGGVSTTDAPAWLSTFHTIGGEVIVADGIGLSGGGAMSTDFSSLSGSKFAKGGIAFGKGVVAGANNQNGIQLATGTLCNLVSQSE
ncbi:MAG TPA: RHS repeat-associated core domain-containing protein, partial [Steroidobacteraceae bacterium]|nr:RHS repeat-associated core domain-containing protein [Steroidobacteraceae bacterium]